MTVGLRNTTTYKGNVRDEKNGSKAEAAQNAAQKAHEISRNDSQDISEGALQPIGIVDDYELLPVGSGTNEAQGMPPEGLEPSTR